MAGPAAGAMRRAGLAPLTLEAKEGLALVNGTQGMLAIGALSAERLSTLLRTADVVAAMTIEAALGTDAPFDDRLQRLRSHPGQAASACVLLLLIVAGCVTVNATPPVSRSEFDLEGQHHPFRDEQDRAAKAGANLLLVRSRVVVPRRDFDCPAAPPITDCPATFDAPQERPAGQR